MEGWRGRYGERAIAGQSGAAGAGVPEFGQDPGPVARTIERESRANNEPGLSEFAVDRSRSKLLQELLSKDHERQQKSKGAMYPMSFLRAH